MHKLSFYISALIMLASLPACARTKKATASGSAPTILEATQQRTKPGRQEPSPFTTYRFRVVWRGKSAPTAIYWRPEGAEWMVPSVAHPVKRPGLAPGDFMVVERNVDIKNVRYGDTLLLTTRHHSHGADLMPSAVKSMPVKSLYYQTAATGDKWLYTTINVRKLPDIDMP